MHSNKDLDLIWPVICKCDALRDLLPFVQFKQREKHPWMSVTGAFILLPDFQIIWNNSVTLFLFEPNDLRLLIVTWWRQF